MAQRSQNGSTSNQNNNRRSELSPDHNTWIDDNENSRYPPSSTGSIPNRKYLKGKEQQPTETSALLETGSQPFYEANAGPYASSYRRHTWHDSLLRRISDVYEDSQVRSGVYDEEKNKQALIQDGSGIRTWYDDYTTIDWIHDYIKERIQLREIYSTKGIRGWLRSSCDGLQGWILLFFIGIVTACFAGVVDVLAEWGSDLKDGYCVTNFRLNKNFCCWDKGEYEECPEWVNWSQAFHVDRNEQMFDYVAYVVVALCFAMLAAILVKYNSLPVLASSKSSIVRPRTSTRFKSYAAGSGIPEVKTILSGFVIRGFLGIRTLWVKAIGLSLVVSAGMTLGKEGPFVHIACCVGNILSRFFRKYNKNEGKRREILSASAAAGVSVAFAAPIGGVLFSLEEVSYYFPSKTLCRSFFCAIVAAVSLKLINPFGTGKIVMFQVSYDKDWHSFEIVSFLLLGVMGGIFGACLCKLIILYTKYVRNRTWLKNWPVVEVILVASCTAIVNYLNPYTRISNTDLVADLFSECTEDNHYEGLCVNETSQIGPIFNLLGLALISKFLTCIITFGTKIPAGIFIPALLIGACFGRMLGLFVQWLTLTYPGLPIFSVCDPSKMNDCIIPGVYAMVGAAASLAGVTRMTVSLTVIMFELTGALTYILPIMTAIMISKWVADGIVKQGIYDLLIDLNGHPYLDSKQDYIDTPPTKASDPDLCERNLDLIDANETNTVYELREKLVKLADSGYTDAGLPIVDGSTLVGYISSNDLEHALDGVIPNDDSTKCYFETSRPVNIENQTADFTAYMEQAPLTVSQNTSLEVILELFRKLGLRYLCVVNAGNYIGVIYKKRLLRHLKKVDPYSK